MPGIVERHLHLAGSGLRNESYDILLGPETITLFSQTTNTDFTTLVGTSITPDRAEAHYPRSVDVKWVNTDAAGTLTVTVCGLDQFGNYVDETYAFAPGGAGTNYAQGTKVFSKVLAIKVDEATDGNASDDLEVGWGVDTGALSADAVVYGLPLKLREKGDIHGIVGTRIDGTPQVVYLTRAQFSYDSVLQAITLDAAVAPASSQIWQMSVNMRTTVK